MRGGVIEPYVKLRIIGHLCDEAECVTKVVPKVGGVCTKRGCSGGDKKRSWHLLSVFQNGFNPSWNETFAFVIRRPEFCFVEFRVKTRSSPDDGHLASYVAPFSLLRSGFRNVPLENYAGARLTPASLFVHVTIGDGPEGTDAHERERALWMTEETPCDSSVSS